MKKFVTIKNMYSVMGLIRQLSEFWRKTIPNIIEILPSDIQIGAATFHPQCFFSTLNPREFAYYYANPCRRNADGRYGQSPNRLLIHHQFQVIISPAPVNIIELYKKSLEYIGISQENNFLKFIENDWKSPSIGAQGVGWEVWANGMEITQFTYFDKMAGYNLPHKPVELAYGLERLLVTLGRKEIWNLNWDQNHSYSWRKIYEEQLSHYYLQYKTSASLEDLYLLIEDLIGNNLYIPAYENFLKANYLFNWLDANGSLEKLSIIEHMTKLRHLCIKIAESYHRNNGIENK